MFALHKKQMDTFDDIFQENGSRFSHTILAHTTTNSLTQSKNENLIYIMSIEVILDQSHPCLC